MLMRASIHNGINLVVDFDRVKKLANITNYNERVIREAKGNANNFYSEGSNNFSKLWQTVIPKKEPTSFKTREMDCRGIVQGGTMAD